MDRSMTNAEGYEKLDQPNDGACRSEDHVCDVQWCHGVASYSSILVLYQCWLFDRNFLCRYGRDVDFEKILDFGMVKQDLGDLGLT